MLETTSLIVQMLTCLALVFAAWQILFHARQMHRDMEMFYVDQYWRLITRASTEWRRTNLSSPVVTAEDQALVFDYLQLCEDEIQLRASARVTDNTWRLWEPAIRAQITQPAFAEVLGAESNRSFYLGLHDLSAYSGREPFDPLPKNWLWRKVHGL